MITEKREIKTGWKNPPTIEQLKEDLTNSHGSHTNNVNRIQRSLDLIHITGSVRRKKVQGKSNVQPKLIRKQLEWRIPSLTEPFLDTDDIFNVRGKTPEDKYAAQQNELILNYQFNTVIDKVPFIDTYVRTFSQEGVVFLRIGWEYKASTKKVMKPVYEYTEATQEELFVLQQALETQREDKHKFTALVPENVKEALRMSQELGQAVFATRLPDDEEVEEFVVEKNQPTIEIVDFRQLHIDPNAKGNLDNAEFIIYEYTTSYDELSKMDKFTNLDNIVFETTDVTALTDEQIESGVDFNFTDKARKRVTAYEYWGNWDINDDGTTVPIVATWVGNTLIQLEENTYPDKQHPFVSTAYIPRKDSVYGETDAALLEDNQAIYGATMRSMIDILARTANGQQGTRQDMLDAVNKRKYARGDNYEFNPSVDPRQGIVNHTSPEIPASAQYMLQLQSNEAESMSGVKAYTSGIGSQALGDVAAGIKGALDATSKRDLTILRRLSHGLIKAARKIIALNAEFLSEEEIVRITEDEYVNVRRDDLQGNFDLSLSISTAEEDDNRASQLAFMLQTLGNTAPFEVTQTILADIARLRKMPNLSAKIAAIKPQPDPLEEAKKQLEVQLLQEQILTERAKQAQYIGSANLDNAKAGNTQADTNQKALDFVEQESGVKQERAKELHQAQSEGNMKLELLKSVLSQQPTERVEPQDNGVTNI